MSNNINVNNENRNVTFQVSTQNNQENNIDIFLPDSNFNYLDTSTTSTDENEMCLVASKTSPQEKVIDGFNNYFLKYEASGNNGEIKWVVDRTHGLENEHYENKIRKNVPLVDFNTLIGSIPVTEYIFDKQDITFTYDAHLLQFNKHLNKLVNINASISDIGLNQLTWNLNNNYYNNNDLDNIKNSELKIETDDSNFELEIKYLTKDSNYEEKKIMEINSNQEFTTSLSCYKVNSCKLVKKNIENTNTVNNSDIKLYFLRTNTNNDEKYSVIKNLKMYKDDNLTCSELNQQYEDIGDPENNQYSNNSFDYNSEFQNEPNQNQFNTRNIRSAKYDIPILIGNDNLIIDTNKKINTEQFNVFKNIYGNIDKDTEFELEGGKGRKASLQIDKEGNIKIFNEGYLYQINDKLRFKNIKLRDSYYLLVNDILNSSDINTETKFIQEYIRKGNSSSNTIKLALGKKEHFLIKKLSISGGINCNVHIKLIQIKNILTSNKQIQYILKDFFYYKRNNINDNYDLDLHIEPSSEIYVNIEKIIRNDEDYKNDMSSLNFTLQGVKISENLAE